jgi:RAB protein geranylgeranyltransferase component A
MNMGKILFERMLSLIVMLGFELYNNLMIVKLPENETQEITMKNMPIIGWWGTSIAASHNS